MMGIGPMELVILAAIALMVMGPEKFPSFAKMAVRFMGDLRGYMDEVKTEVTKELKPMQQELRKLQSDMNTATAPPPKPYAPPVRRVEQTGEETEAAVGESRQPEYGPQGYGSYTEADARAAAAEPAAETAPAPDAAAATDFDSLGEEQGTRERLD